VEYVITINKLGGNMFMKQLENAVKFFGKFYILAIPLLVLNALPALIQGGAAISLISNFTQFINSYDIIKGFQDPLALFRLISSVLSYIIGGSILAIILHFVVEPATYGMVNNGLQYGQSDLNDFVPALKQNFVKYVLYWVGTLVVSAVFGIAAVIVFVILVLLTIAIKWLGALLIVIAILGFIIAGFVLYTLISLWYSSMVVDNLDVVSGFKRSVEVVKSNFWTILGIKILLWVVGAVAGGIVNAILGWIPVIGPIISSIVPTIITFVAIVFYLVFYREKTGQEAAA